jgi:HK97 gp10 family phage protein
LIKMQLKGLEALKRQLDQLPDQLAVKVLAKAARKAFMPVIEAARSAAPVKRGVLRDAIKITVKKPSKGDPLVVVGLRIGGARAKADGRVLTKKQARSLQAVGGEIDNPARRWHFAEFGTAFAAAHPFIRPAWDANKIGMIETLKTELSKEIKRALKGKR